MLGFVSCLLIMIFRGKARHLHWLAYVLAALFLEAGSLLRGRWGPQGTPELFGLTLPGGWFRLPRTALGKAAWEERSRLRGVP